MDACDLFVNVARDAHSGAVFYLDDLRRLPVNGPFDAVLSWFNGLSADVVRRLHDNAALGKP